MTAIRLRNTWLVDDDAQVHQGDFLLHPDGTWAASDGTEEVAQDIEASDRVITRSLQNWHTHLAMTLLRSMGEGLTLQDWLNDVIFPTEKGLTPRLVEVGTRAAAAEMIRTGTTFACDMYHFAGATASVLADAGLRALLATPVTDFPTPAYPRGAAQALAQAENLLSGPSPAPGRISFGLGPHSVYTCSPDSLRKSRDLAAEFGATVSIHLCETEQEILDCVAMHGSPPTAYLDDLGLLTPGTVVAHCGWLDPQDHAVLAERGAIAVHCPTSNMKLATRQTLPYPQLAGAGVDVRLGTDGVASNNVLDMRAEVKTAALLQRHQAGDPTVLPPAEAWRMATRGSQDWVTWGLGDIRMHPMGSAAERLLGNLIFSTAECRDMWVAGRAIRRDGVTLTLDEAAVAEELEAAAAELTGS